MGLGVCLCVHIPEYISSHTKGRGKGLGSFNKAIESESASNCLLTLLIPGSAKTKQPALIIHQLFYLPSQFLPFLLQFETLLLQ